MPRPDSNRPAPCQTWAALPALAACAALAVLAPPGALAGEATIRGYTFRVADGFTVELAAEAPLVNYPICADFDERGRLYVSESSGATDWNKPQPADRLHPITRLEDTDGDGRFDRRTTYAQMDICPQGAMWLDGSLYVAAAPLIWKFTDADDDGVAEQREKWVEQSAVTGCLNDIRGPYKGPDGYVYWCKGPAVQTYQVQGQPWTSAARHLVRRHPHGTDVDPLMVGGMDNLIEIAFSAGGERFVTATNFHLLSEPRDDGILHALYGGVYPKDLAVVYDFPWTGPSMLRPMVGWGALSPAGLMTYQGDAWGPEYRGNLFSALFSGHNVLRHVLTPAGATFACRDEVLLGTDNVQFHPTDVLEDADGSLLVIETGGWYLHCCPSSNFYRPDVRGAIYRVRRTGPTKLDDPRGLRLAWDTLDADELAALLSDPRPAVRARAVDRLGALGAAAVPALTHVRESSASPRARTLAVWAAARIEDPAARALAREALDDADATVQLAAIHTISLHRDRAAVDPLVDRLADRSPHLRRAAAEALGRLGDSSAAGELLRALAGRTDRSLEHSLIYALIELGDAAAVRPALASAEGPVRRAAWIVLDQLPDGSLPPEAVLAELESKDPALRDAAWWIVGRHASEWGGRLAETMRARLDSAQLDGAAREELADRLAQLARSPEFSAWLVGELTRAGIRPDAQLLLLQAMRRAGGQQANPAWIEALLGLMAREARGPLAEEAVITLASLPPLGAKDDRGKQLRADADRALRATAVRGDLGDATRLRALTAVQGGSLGKLDDELLAFLLRKLAPEEELAQRSMAADVLARATLSSAQLERVAGSLKNVGLAELNRVLELFRKTEETSVGLKLVASLEGSAAAGGLNALRLRACLAGFDDSVQQAAAGLLRRIEASQAEQLARAERIAALVATADIPRGQQVFHSQKAACTACHKTAHVGSEIGPHLRGIGQRRTERDLIEAIVFPSAAVVQSYESWSVLLDDGRVLTGVIHRETRDELVLSAGPDKTYRVPRAAIEEMTRSDTSIMPAGLDKLLTEQDLADLVAYLKSLK